MNLEKLTLHIFELLLEHLESLGIRDSLVKRIFSVCGLSLKLDILFGSPVLDNFDFDSFLMPIEDNHWTRDAFVTWRHVGPAAEICLQNLIAIGSNDSQAARKGEEIRSERFNNGMAALEAESAKRRWREEGSLMEFA